MTEADRIGELERAVLALTERVLALEKRLAEKPSRLMPGGPPTQHWPAYSSPRPGGPHPAMQPFRGPHGVPFPPMGGRQI